MSFCCICTKYYSTIDDVHTAFSWIKKHDNNILFKSPVAKPENIKLQNTNTSGEWDLQKQLHRLNVSPFISLKAESRDRLIHVVSIVVAVFDWQKFFFGWGAPVFLSVFPRFSPFFLAFSRFFPVFHSFCSVFSIESCLQETISMPPEQGGQRKMLFITVDLGFVLGFIWDLYIDLVNFSNSSLERPCLATWKQHSLTLQFLFLLLLYVDDRFIFCWEALFVLSPSMQYLLLSMFCFQMGSNTS